jgi:hypothetical protein
VTTHTTAPVRLATAVVGAGPAGLLFCVALRCLWARAGHPPESLVLRLFDKRTAYLRTHRMRLDPAPYAALVAALADPRVDRLAAFLAGCHHAPAVDALERELSAIAEACGVVREPLAVGTDPGEVDLAAVRARVVEGLPPGVPVTIVGADSVHSTVRRLAGSGPSVRVTHEQLARLSVTGPDLPETLSALHTYRLAKVVASILDWRRPAADRAEVDLFLSPSEFGVIRDLGASPREPVILRPDDLDGLRAPLFARFVRVLAQGFGGGPCTVSLTSAFRLEHAIAPRRALRPPGLDAAVFLVGDAGASLPFQRGMACLARSALALARAHVDGATPAAAARYDDAVSAIVAEELAVVRSRARLVTGLRAFVRLSALAPFPIQSWFLSLPPDGPPPPDRWTPGLALNAAVAAAVVAVALLPAGSPVAPLLALPLGAAGGLVYRATLTFEPPPHRYVVRVWQVAIGGLLVGGVAAAVLTSAAAGAPRRLGLLGLWWVVGLAFVAGMVAFEELGRRWVRDGRLDEVP